MKLMIKSPLHQRKSFWWLLNGFVIYQRFQVYPFAIRYRSKQIETDNVRENISSINEQSKETSSNSVALILCCWSSFFIFYWHILILRNIMSFENVNIFWWTRYILFSFSISFPLQIITRWKRDQEINKFTFNQQKSDNKMKRKLSTRKRDLEVSLLIFNDKRWQQ